MTLRLSEAEYARHLGKASRARRNSERPAAKGESADNAVRVSRGRQKYRAQPTLWFGLRFDSKAELNHWRMLSLLQTAGKISDLQRQVAYPLLVDGVKVGRITWDFQYIVNGTGEFVIADCKSPPTRKETAYRLRKRLFLACYPRLSVTEIE